MRITELCEKIFEKKNIVTVNELEKEQYTALTGMEISEEYLYILENYTGVYVKEEYGFKAIQQSPFAGEDGFDVFSDFIGLSGRDNFFKVYETYAEQLPQGVYPMAEIDGGNLLCVEAATGQIYVWLHDEPEGEDLFLAAESLRDLLERMEKMPKKETKGSGVIVESVRLSEELLAALRNYKK